MRKPMIMGTVAFLTAASAYAATPLPKEKTGVSNVETAVVPLPMRAGETEATSLRMRKITIAPSGGLPMHAHKNRPSVAYVLEGTLTEYLENAPGTPRQHAAGTSYATFETGHALVNETRKLVVILEVDLPVAPPAQ